MRSKTLNRLCFWHLEICYDNPILFTYCCVCVGVGVCARVCCTTALGNQSRSAHCHVTRAVLHTDKQQKDAP